VISYESIFIVPADCSTQRIEDMIEKVKNLITSKGGQVTKIDKWGRKRLSYPIRRNREGFYVFISFDTTVSSLVAEISQIYRVSDDIIRHMTVKAPEASPVPPPSAVPAAPSAEPTTQEVKNEQQSPAPSA